jgi:hypothetical protein
VENRLSVSENWVLRTIFGPETAFTTYRHGDQIEEDKSILKELLYNFLCVIFLYDLGSSREDYRDYTENGILIVMIFTFLYT